MVMYYKLEDEYPTAMHVEDNLRIIIISTNKYFFYVLYFDEVSRQHLKIEMIICVD